MLKLTLIESELGERIKWLVKLRWVFIASALLAVTIAAKPLKAIDEPLPLYGVIGFLAGFNILFQCLLTRIRCYRDEIEHIGGRVEDFVRYENRIINVQICVDTSALAMLIYFSGGIANPFMFYFVFNMIIATIILSRTAAYFQASFAVLLMSFVFLLEYNNHIPYNYIEKFSPGSIFMEKLYYIGIMFAFTTTLYLSVFLGTSIVKRLREKENQLLILKDSLDERAGELERVNTKLVETYKLKSEYIIKVTHELRSPLATMKSCLKVLTDGYVEVLSKKTKDLLLRVEDKLDILMDTIEDLMSLSIIKSGKVTHTSGIIIIKDILSKVMPLFDSQAQEKRITITCNLQKGITPIIGDKENIESLLTNLISNAVKYTPDGGSIQIKTHGRNGGIELVISDTGIGIPEEEIPNIFNDFYRTKEAIAMEKKGTGLGLSLVKQVVEQHNGEIKVFSKAGEGTTFTILLNSIREPYPKGIQTHKAADSKSHQA